MLPNSRNAVKVGDKVILGRHEAKSSKPGSDNWCEDMDRNVGKTGIVTDVIYEADMEGCYTVAVDTDNEMFAWRIENLTLVAQPVVFPTAAAFNKVDKVLSSISRIEPEDYSKPCVCVKCGDTNHYMPYKANHVCYGCNMLMQKLG